MPILAPYQVIFVERAPHLRRHPGQIGFPGGLAEPADGEDPRATALRELAEELGVGAERVTIVDRLPDLEQSFNRFVISPVVGVLDAGTRISPVGEEIAATFTVPLARIVADGAIYEDVETTRTRGRLAYAFDHEGMHVWGFTARVLRSFADAWNASPSDLRERVAAALAATE